MPVLPNLQREPSITAVFVLREKKRQRARARREKKRQERKIVLQNILFYLHDQIGKISMKLEKLRTEDA